MASKGSAWGMEIGACAIKAIRLERDGDDVRVTDFAHIPHKKVLTTPDVDQNELIRLSLGQFISQKQLEGEHLVMSVPGHAAFARFAKLPPVEPKKVPDIVKFEAVQQIPFPIEQVEWDYQTFMAEDSPEVEVGIFAITRDRVQQKLELYGELGIIPEALNLSPVAVYNAMRYDHGLADRDGPVIYLDIGTSATDVIVAEEGRCWIRTFPLGGTHFTEAIASAFKLSYPKAEKLKLEAATSKYAKQIMQAMRPVFSDLLQDLQRSIGYYQTAHSEQELKTMVGLGSTFKIPGLRKFLGQQLQLNVVRLDEYKKIRVTGREAASFAESAVNMSTAYGLALQGCGLANIDANLVPVKSLRDQMWHTKTKWFGVAAAIAILGGAMMLWRPMTEKGSMEAVSPQSVEAALASAKKYKQDYDAINQDSGVGFTAINMTRLLDDRVIWPYLVTDAASSLAATGPQDVLLQGKVEEILELDPGERRFVQLRELKGAYELDTSAGPATAGVRKIRVTMDVELSHDDPVSFLNSHVATWLRANAQPEGDRADVPYRILSDSVEILQTQLARYEVEDGAVKGEARSSGGGKKPAKPAAGVPGGGRTTGGPAGGSAGGMSGAGGGTMGGGGGTKQGRRQWSGEQKAAPGPGAGGMSTGSGSTGGGGGAQKPETWKQPGQSRTRSKSEDELNIDRMAPLDDRPLLYKDGQAFYRVPIEFVVEIIDPNAPKKPDPSNSAQAGGKESRS